ncbi:MAG: hypothetical protein Q8Q85_10880, partial [Gemmatimonadales bacterium]|nr:hypothetical protein [Gemmatimonadales bacterium]
MSTQLFGRDRIGFLPTESWRGGEDGDGGDLTGVAPLRTSRSFLDPYSGRGGEDLRVQAVEFTTPEDLCAAMEAVELLGLDEESLELLLNGEEEEGEVPASSRTRRPRRTKRPPEVFVNGQPLEDHLAGKPNTAA